MFASDLVPASASIAMVDKQQMSVENKIFYQLICIQVIRFALR